MKLLRAHRRWPAPQRHVARALLLLWTGFCCHDLAAVERRPDLTELSLEQLMQVEVTTVSKKPERRFDSPAAVFVLTQDDIRRSGATNIPDLLRLVPGVEVGRIDSHTWFIGVRGFASQLSRSLLVLVDGRSVYSPLFAGAYWDVQDTLLEDIDRIEVVLGPGGSLWGANAVNGVINIITRNAYDTQGGSAVVRIGNQERGNVGVRYGGKTKDDTAWRVYGKAFDRDGLHHADGDTFDAWRTARTGFRMDRRGSKADVMIQGDAYTGRSGQRTTLTLLEVPYSQTVEAATLFSGADVLARWSATEGGSKWQIQTYYDRTVREESMFRETRDTVDVDAQNQLHLGAHELTYGASYRLSRGATAGTQTTFFTPLTRTDQLVTAFVEGEIAVVPDSTHLILGSKFEVNDYSGFEWQPNMRLSFAPDEGSIYWVSATRAVRTPSRVEEDLTLIQVADPTTPVFVRLTGNRDFDSETVIAYEAGHRRQLGRDTSLELSLFNNYYRNFISAEPGTPVTEPLPSGVNAVFIPFLFGNGMRVNTRGGEAALQWLPRKDLRFSAHYAYIYIAAEPTASSADTISENNLENGSPQHMAVLRFGWDPMRAVDLDMDLRYVSERPAVGSPEYLTADMRVSYWFSRQLELALVGRDLFTPHHSEFGAGTPRAVEVNRSGYVAAKWYW